MDHLPSVSNFEEQSAADARALEEFLYDAYGWRTTSASIERASATLSSDVYRVNAEVGRIIVKRTRWYRPDNDGSYHSVIKGLSFIYRGSEALRDQGVPLPRIFDSLSGENVVSWEGQPTIVQEYVEGAELQFTESSFQEAGTALAIFHREGSAWLAEDSSRLAIASLVPVEMPYEESREMYREQLKDELERPHVCQYPESCKSIKANRVFLEEQMVFVDESGVNAPTRQQGWLHNDFHAGNLLVGESEKVKAILDIDQAGVGPYVWDLGNTLASFATQLKKMGRESEIESMTNVFLRGYHQFFPLPAEEYASCLPATQRWDLMRILRGLRRHRYENDRLGELFKKTPERLIPRLRWAPGAFAFLTRDWIHANIVTA